MLVVFLFVVLLLKIIGLKEGFYSTHLFQKRDIYIFLVSLQEDTTLIKLQWASLIKKCQSDPHKGTRYPCSTPSASFVITQKSLILHQQDSPGSRGSTWRVSAAKGRQDLRWACKPGRDTLKKRHRVDHQAPELEHLETSFCLTIMN